ncbi:ribokinase [Chromobacterium haemolyticum]|uniref:Ribokinase n=1 Tax=Chromobacterium fluminis TaxID=3044269 RepID=A0ABX0LMQ9_9NEIS|nr:ribokinase [Chromobacterium haemolyticum]NHR08417.1 ribokinase [Chromobacterium haemolyticum]OQS40674.1 ribokinase [Chromobacterium haemolyticum]
MTRVLVVGSVNMDLVVEAERYPRLGETLFGKRFASYPGGKGANQAVAAARLGAQVTLLGCVGRDMFGSQLKEALQAEGVDIGRLREAEVATGLATITLAEGDNAIVVVPGANHELLPQHLDQDEQAFRDADVVLAQMEVPLATVERAAELAQRHGKPFLLNPAPAHPLPSSLLERAALLTPNEHELAQALDERGGDWQALMRKLPGRVAMTRGKDGAYFCRADGSLHHQPGFVVSAVDTTGAGDTFNGALAAFWPQGLEAAMALACAAAALSVTRAGAQGGMPTLAALQQMLKEQA